MLPAPRRLLPHLAASYGGAALDNLFQFAAGATLTSLAYQRLSGAEADALARDFTAYALALFMLPTIVLSPLAGNLGDRTPKQLIFRAARCLDLLVAALGVLGLWLAAPWLIFAALFLLGCTTAFFSPVKYSAIPELVSRDDLPAANAWVQAVTIGAIVSGMAMGGLCDPRVQAWIGEQIGVTFSISPALTIACLSLLLCGIGIAGALTVPTLPAQRPQAALAPLSFVQQLQAITSPGIFIPIISLCGFWALGAATKTLIQPVAVGVWAAGEGTQALLFLSIAGGIAIGAALAAPLMQRTFPAGAPIAGGLIAGGALLAAGLLALQSGSLWAFAFCLLLCGVGAGLWEVPLQVFVQERSRQEERTRILAGANLTSNIAIIMAALAVGPGASALGLDGPSALFALGLLSTVLALAALGAYRGQVACWLGALLLRALFRIDARGWERLPQQGGCLIAANHISLADGVLLAATLPRRARFMVYKWYCDLPVIGWVLKAWGVIPVDAQMPAKALIAAVQAATNAARAGEVVVVFPEGKLSRSGILDRFRPGIERIAREAGVPIVPCAISGLWRSPWSFAPQRQWSPLWRRPVHITLGEPLPCDTPAPVVRQAVSRLLAEQAIARCEDERRTLGAETLARCRTRPRALAVIDARGVLPRWQLAGAALTLRTRLGLAPDEQHVGVLLPPGRGGAVANLALALAGRTAVNLNHTAGAKQLRRMCELAGIKTLITADLYLQRIGDPQLPLRYVRLDALLPAIPKIVILWHALRAIVLPPSWLDKARPQAVAALVFSSGTTGDPKGVQLTHAQILANCDSINAAIMPEPQTVLLSPLPLFHSFGLVPGMWLPLTTGFTVAAHPDPNDAKGVGELAAQARATFTITTATFARGWLRRIPAEQFSALRFAIAGAEKCPKELRDAFREKFGAELLEGYGCTELAPVVSTNLPAVTVRGEREELSRDHSVGRPLPGIHVMATDIETRAVLPPGREGLLVVISPARMLGYLGRDDLTAKAFIHGGYDTGDVGFVDEDGFVHITGRLARFAKIGGEMVPLDLVEETLQAALSGLGELAVVAVPDPERGERLVVLVAGEQVPEPQALLAAASQLPPLWRPRARDIYRVESLPVLGTGKRDLGGIKRLARSCVEGSTAGGPSPDAQEAARAGSATHTASSPT
ncbi:MAG: MFS transporter [Planctomycetota bacterium]|nr:MFS transporter [Planctomycetota bacterium]MDW8372997.1 MFS transporter [Planctomycetota bacterium]